MKYFNLLLFIIMKTKILTLLLVTLVLTVCVYAKTSQKMYSCMIPTDASINDLYKQKWNCLEYKADLIRQWNEYYQEHDDKWLSRIQWLIKEIDDKNATLDNLIKNKIPRTFR